MTYFEWPLTFYRAIYPAFVRLEARANQIKLTDAEVDQIAYFLLKKKVRSVGGSRLRDATAAARLNATEKVVQSADSLKTQVFRRIKAMDAYSFRHTHATWASDRGIPDVCISKQLGHALRSTTGRYQNLQSRTLIDARRCSHAVWNMLLGFNAVINCAYAFAP